MRGRVRLGRRTKELIPLLRPGEIAVICHEELDAVAAAGLADSGAAAVINARHSLSCRYPNLGPRVLQEQGILLLDNVGEAVFSILQDGDMVEIIGRQVFRDGEPIATGTVVTAYLIEARHKLARINLPNELDRFVTNTLHYAEKEKHLILKDLNFPELKVAVEGRPVVVVVRGIGYREDLHSLAPFLQEAKPVLIGVDGGADALLAFGYKPHLIVGDMDSVSDGALTCGAQLIAHAYQNGECPGAARLEEMGLAYDLLPAPGTSEDVALLFAHAKKAEIIVLVGSHSNMIDFLEKGRPGMASTFLTRLKIGPILLDAKKVSELYRARKPVPVLPVLFIALVPIVVFLALSSPWRHYLRLLWLQLRLIAGWL